MQKNFLRGITVRQPWAHAIIFLGKDVENRPRRFHHRGPLVIHAGKGMDREEAVKRGLDPDRLVRGAIVGIVDMVDCVRNHKSKWANKGAWHWVLRNPRALKKPIQYKGKQGVLLIPRELLAGVGFARMAK